MNSKSKNKRGLIIAIGGAEDKSKKKIVLKRFVEGCNKRDPSIAIIPTASMLSDTGEIYSKLFKKLGAGQVEVLNIKHRRDCNRESYLEIIDKVDGVFFTGGDQLRLSTIIGQTPLAKKLKSRNRGGMAIAGTSAGAAFVCEHMIAGGKSGNMPRCDMVQIGSGLGLIDELVIDQHFRQRHRIGRLLTAVTYNPACIGVGIDEDTAIVIHSDNTFNVIGNGWVTIIDPKEMEASVVDDSPRQLHLSIADVRLHVLASGGCYNYELLKVLQ